MAVLKWITPADVTEEDFDWLAKAEFAGPAYDRIQEITVKHALHNGTMHLFRFVPGPGVLLVETPVNDSGIKRLALLRAAGLGTGWTFPQIAALLVKTAREWGCEAVETMVYDDRLAEAMKLVGAKTEARKMILEA